MEHTGGAARPKWQFTGYQVTHSDVSVTDSQGQTIDKTEASDDSWLIKKDGVYDFEFNLPYDVDDPRYQVIVCTNF